jgi:hypothetical protein
MDFYRGSLPKQTIDIRHHLTGKCRKRKGIQILTPPFKESESVDKRGKKVK